MPYFRFVGKITDDYGLDRAWFEYQVDAAPTATEAALPATAAASRAR